MSELTIKQAADQVRQLLRIKQSVDQLADFLDNITRLENTVGELETAITDRQTAITGYDENIRQLTEAQRMIEAKAAKTVDEARAEADAILQEARRQADEIVSTAQSNANTHEQRATDQQTALKLAQEQLANVTAAIEASQADLDRLQAALANTVKDILARAPAPVETPPAPVETPPAPVETPASDTKDVTAETPASTTEQTNG